MQLGIVHQRIHPASPQENGQHERMHRELKRETTRPAASSLRAQQRRFEAFRARYNDVRPHEGIGDRTPTSLWRPSLRAYPEHRLPPAYPAHLEVRRISTAGTFRLHAKQPFLSQVLQGEDIGLEEVGDGLWNIVYYSTLLGKIDERTLQITGTQSRRIGVKDPPGLS
jgi:putative transposase